MAKLDKSALTSQAAMPQEDVELEGLGTVVVRGLSRYETLLATKGIDETDTLRIEQRMVAMGMVEPVMSEKDVAAWQKASPLGQMKPITSAINRLSGIGTDAGRDAYKSVRDDA